MSAEQYGARLLEDVQEESLEQFLAELRLRSRPRPHPHTRDVTTAFSRLDALLDPWAVPGPIPTRHTSLESSTARSPITHVGLRGAESEGGDDDDDEDATHGNNDIPYPYHGLSKATVEITSRKSCCGKTMLLYYLSALTALPKPNGGRESVVVYIDSDGTFSSTRLYQVMQHCLSTRAHAHEDTALDSSESLQTLAREALTHVLVYRPQSSTHLLAILDSLPTMLLDRTKHSSIHRTLGLLVLDSATSFYWQDRLDRDMARLQSKSPGVVVGVNKTSGQSSRTSQIIERLKSVQKKFECAIMFSTKHAPSKASAGPSNATTEGQTRQSQPRPQLQPPPPPPPNESTTPPISPWSAYASLTLRLDKAHVPQFAPQMSMDECLRDAEKRFDAVRNAKVIATVTSKRDLDRRGEQQQTDGFSFRISDGGGIDFEEDRGC